MGNVPGTSVYLKNQWPTLSLTFYFSVIVAFGLSIQSVARKKGYSTLVRMLCITGFVWLLFFLYFCGVDIFAVLAGHWVFPDNTTVGNVTEAIPFFRYANFFGFEILWITLAGIAVSWILGVYQDKYTLAQGFGDGNGWWVVLPVIVDWLMLVIPALAAEITFWVAGNAESLLALLLLVCMGALFIVVWMVVWGMLRWWAGVPFKYLCPRYWTLIWVMACIMIAGGCEIGGGEWFGVQWGVAIQWFFLGVVSWMGPLIVLIISVAWIQNTIVWDDVLMSMGMRLNTDKYVRDDAERQQELERLVQKKEL